MMSADGGDASVQGNRSASFTESENINVGWSVTTARLHTNVASER
jgi:hypothetical protein